MQNRDHFPETVLYRLPQVEAVTGLKRSSIYAKLDPRSKYFDPEMPRPVKIGKRAVAWDSSAVHNWKNTREVATNSLSIKKITKAFDI